MENVKGENSGQAWELFAIAITFDTSNALYNLLLGTYPS